MGHEDPAEARSDAKTTARRLARGVLAVARTRLELLLVEIQEERERCVVAILLCLGCVACAFLACVTLTAGWMAIAWPHSPALAVALPFGIYTLAAIGLYRRLAAILRVWRTLPETLDQLRKDRECFETWLD